MMMRRDCDNDKEDECGGNAKWWKQQLGLMTNKRRMDSNNEKD